MLGVMMKIIAFKRAKNSPLVKNSLHPEFIIEFADTSLFEPNFHKESDGYEFLDEDKFNEEYAQNEDRHAQFLEDKKQRDLLKEKNDKQIQAIESAKKREEERLYKQFLKWKQTRGK